MVEFELTVHSGGPMYMSLDECNLIYFQDREWLLGASGYAYAYFEGRVVYAHHMLLGCPSGLRKGDTIKHLDGDLLNNRLSNLLYIPAQQAQRGRPAHSQKEYAAIRREQRRVAARELDRIITELESSGPRVFRFVVGKQ